MSYHRFQDPRGSAHLRGTERPWLLHLIHAHAHHVLLEHPDASDLARTLFDLLPPSHELREIPLSRVTSPRRWLDGYARQLQNIIFDDPIVTHRGHQIRPLTLLLNTAMDTGSEPLRLAARLIGQSEINTWVDGPNRVWLADVVAEGLKSGTYRSGRGWEEVQNFLRAHDDHPTVVSFSDTFPTWCTARLRTADGEYLHDDVAVETWEGLTPAEQWTHGIEDLRSRATDLLEMTPNWANYRFAPTVSLSDLLAPDHTHRLDQALQPTG